MGAQHRDEGGRNLLTAAHELERRLTDDLKRGAKPSEPVVLLPEQVATLDLDTMRFLTKKLVHLTVLLEQDTVADDAKYPSFYSV